MQGAVDIIAYCVMPMLDPWDFCKASQLSKMWCRSGRLWLSKSPMLKHALRYYAINGMTEAYERLCLTPEPSDILNAIHGGKTDFVKRWLNVLPSIYLDNRNSKDAKHLRSYLEACIDHGRNELFALLYQRGGWYFPKLLEEAAKRGNVVMLKQMAHPSQPSMSMAVDLAYYQKQWPAYNYLISRGARPHYQFNELVPLHEREIGRRIQNEAEDVDVEAHQEYLELF